MNLRLNVVGPQVRQWRTRKGWTQETLAQRMQLLGWTISRHSLAKLELQLRRVPDCELLFLAKVLGVTANDLLPRNPLFKKLGPEFQTGPRLSIFPTRAEK